MYLQTKLIFLNCFSSPFPVKWNFCFFRATKVYGKGPKSSVNQKTLGILAVKVGIVRSVRILFHPLKQT